MTATAAVFRQILLSLMTGSSLLVHLMAWRSRRSTQQAGAVAPGFINMLSWQQNLWLLTDAVRATFVRA